MQKSLVAGWNVWIWFNLDIWQSLNSLLKTGIFSRDLYGKLLTKMSPILHPFAITILFTMRLEYGQAFWLVVASKKQRKWQHACAWPKADFQTSTVSLEPWNPHENKAKFAYWGMGGHTEQSQVSPVVHMIEPNKDQQSYLADLNWSKTQEWVTLDQSWSPEQPRQLVDSWQKVVVILSHSFLGWFIL